jgi:hypothetical protein
VEYFLYNNELMMITWGVLHGIYRRGRSYS